MLSTRSATLLRLVTLAVVAIAARDLYSQASTFDTPIREVTVKLGWSQSLMANDRRPVELHCHYYPSFVVKEELDPAVKGAVWIAVAPSTDTKTPQCRTASAAGQRRLRDEEYFSGVKSKYIFLQAADGLNEGIEFVVIDQPTGRKIFQDVALSSRRRYIPDLRFDRTAAGDITIAYRRVVVTRCSIPQSGITCWRAIRHRYAIPLSPIPKCVGYQQPGEPESKANDLDSLLEPRATNSAIAYPVLVSLAPRPKTASTAGPVRCNAEE
jgi:hypothetical protein